MLKRRFKQSLPSDHHHHHLLSPLPPSSSSHFLPSPSSSSLRFFSDSDPAMSPTSVLELNKPFSSSTPAAGLLLAGDKRPPARLGIADALAGEASATAALFARPKLLRVRDLAADDDPPRSPTIEFGIKTRDSQLGLLEAAAAASSSSSSSSPAPKPFFGRSLSAREMEMSEEYTCVISHGPNPTTTHIFDGCVVESDHLSFD